MAAAQRRQRGASLHNSDSASPPVVAFSPRHAYAPDQQRCFPAPSSLLWPFGHGGPHKGTGGGGGKEHKQVEQGRGVQQLHRGGRGGGVPRAAGQEAP